MLVYVDDMLITGDSLKLVEERKASSQQAFKMKDLGELRYFLGLSLRNPSKGLSCTKADLGINLKGHRSP